MYESDLPSAGGAHSTSAAARAVRAASWRARSLVDAPRPAGGYPLAWYIEAQYIGDFTAVAAAAVRAAAASSVPPAC
jgi:hypothetical protein